VSYLALSFEVGSIDPEQAETSCFDMGALSVTFSDERDDAVLEPLPGEVRLWPHTRLTALFAAKKADAGLIVRLATALELPIDQLQAQSLADRAWEREWLRDFHAMRFGRRLWVSPRHETVHAADGVIVRLDPGLAFGTGTHASTALCLAWLDGTQLSGLTVIDYGCGSGVLGIAAVKLGARCVHAFDLDPQALLATRENAADNDVAAALRICKDAALLPQECDVMVANILSETLVALAPALAARVISGGSVLLAGILAPQEPEVAACYSPWFDMGRFAARDGWVALQGRRH
jgi:ribosomal protein L11 methyltransferase